jgi:hypothetical protein
MGYKNADLVVGTMPNISEHVNSVCKNTMNCACVPFGFILDDYKEILVQEVTNNRYAIPANKFVIGYAGSIGLSNGLDTLLKLLKN